MPYNHKESIFTIHTKTGAECIGHVLYSTSHKAVSFKEQLVKATGVIVWKWHEETKGLSGVASVICTYRGATERATARFTVTHTP